MTFHEDELASSQPAPADHETEPHDPPPQPDGMPPPRGPTESGATILLHWCILIGGMAAVAFVAWLFE